ncbi:MAG: hypothetical protein HOV81_38845 [Kofleriaceae bacterium]|nr:hypothetical protein [Kofleriaceae bacterium]
MAYLDDELADEERHELEAHLTECAACRAHLDQERADVSLVRRSLVAPPASDMFRARLARALDGEERIEQAAQRRRWYQYLLPGSAMVAAAAAIALFVGVQAPGQNNATRTATVVHQAAREGVRPLPLEVRGSETDPWVRTRLAVSPPRFQEPNAKVLGARELPAGIEGHQAGLISYEINLTGNPFLLSVLVVRDVNADDWREGQAVRLGDRTVHVVSMEDGTRAVSYVDGAGRGYLFMAPQLTVNELVWLVGRTDLVGTR